MAKVGHLMGEITCFIVGSCAQELHIVPCCMYTLTCTTTVLPWEGTECVEVHGTYYLCT